ncbi:MAG: putative Ig domain-containing protein, partial [Burkholderiales bacterium]|nr:putative Ig domain-containing protein [Burkholderiales bacterium]
MTISWTVRNIGEGQAVGVGGTWYDYVFAHDTADISDPNAKVWFLGAFERVNSLDALQSYTQTRSFNLAPSLKGLHVSVIADGNPIAPFVIESNEGNNVKTVDAPVVARPADLKVTSIVTQPVNYSGEKTSVTWTVRNDGADVWSGTHLWSDRVYISPDPTFGNRAISMGSFVHAAGGGLASGQSYSTTADITVPAGWDGPYYIYVFTDAAPEPNAAEAASGKNSDAYAFYGGSVYEGAAATNNMGRADIAITYREPDLKISQISVPGALTSGQTVAVSFTVTNQGTRDTRQWGWADRIYLSRDPSLDNSDLQLASFTHLGGLAKDGSYTVNASVQIPADADGPFYLIAYTDADVYGQEPNGAANVGVKQVFQNRDAVPEFRGEGNNVVVVPVQVTLAPAADLRVASVVAPDHATRGQSITVNYTVVNDGGAATPADATWRDQVYLSVDPVFDPRADRYLGDIEHKGAVAAGGQYQGTGTFKLPAGLTGSYYVFVVTDPVTNPGGEPRGKVYEATHEDNNATARATPLLIELPPPSDLVVGDIVVPPTAVTGESVKIKFSVTNQAGIAAEGSWTDAVYLSVDSAWGLQDILLGKVLHNGTLAVGDSYLSELTAKLPPAKAGSYRIIVRSDIYNEVNEGVNERNNTTASAAAVAVSVPTLALGVPLQTTLAPGEQRLYRVAVGANETLKIALDAADNLTSNELYVRYGDAASPSAFDFGALQVLSADPSTLVPTTQAGDYYVLIQGRPGSGAASPVTLTARTLPFSITDISQDQGGDSKWVSATITGAGFKPGAVVKLVRPGILEVAPARYEVIDATTIKAIFDLTNVPHGLYDVAVINPDGAVATLPYRYLVETALPIDVTIGLGGPRVVPSGQTGLYSISLQSLTNVDTPYVYFSFGVTELGDNAKVYGLPYTTFSSNVSGKPDGNLRSDVGWASLDSEVNSFGTMLAPGYALDVEAGGYVGMNFAVTTYPGLQAIFDRNFDAYKRAVYDARPDLAKADVLKGGVGSLGHDLAEWFNDPNAKIDDCIGLFAPFLFNVNAAATPLTRDEFVALQTKEAERLRSAVLADTTANAALVNLAADRDTWVKAYLGALEESGLLRPADQAPPIRTDEKVISLMATLTSGILVGPVGRQISGPATLSAFFDQMHKWYGDMPGTITDLLGVDMRESQDCGEYGIPVPVSGNYGDYNLALSHPTYFQSINIFSPFSSSSSVTSTDPGFSSLASSNTLTLLDLQKLFEQIAQNSNNGATLVGPNGFGAEQFLPANTPLPYTIKFSNPAGADSAADQVRVSTVLDGDLSVRSFRLGDIKVGGVTIHVPQDRASFQGDFDLRNSLGFIVRVSAGVDPDTRIATWLLQAIDPDTGELLQDATRGLLQPDDAQGRGQGFVSYTVQAAFEAQDGATINAQARVELDSRAPMETALITSRLDVTPPRTTITAAPVQAGSADYQVQWQATDGNTGSGVRSTTVYVREDGGAWAIWKQQTTDSNGVYSGRAGHSYQFLALSIDNAGNRELAPSGDLPGDGTVVDVGGTPQVGRTTQDIAPAPAPSNADSTNELFLKAQQNLPGPVSSRPSLFQTVLAPFAGEAFGTGITQSFSGIGPLAILQRPDGKFIVSGGGNRGALYLFDATGGKTLAPAVQLDSPVYDLAYDASGGLWATSGGGQLLELDPQTLEIINRYGDSITQSLAFDRAKGVFYVSSGNGVEAFDPVKRTFTHFSNIRVDDLAIAPDGSLWATAWPKRGQVIRFDAQGRAQAQLDIDAALDSLTFGQAGTALQGLLFVSARIPSGSTDKASLYMVDLATMNTLAVAKGGPSAEQLLATDDGRLLIANRAQVDVLAPLVAPAVLRTSPAAGAIVALPISSMTVTFDHDMRVGSDGDLASVTNVANYSLVDATGKAVAISSLAYDAVSRTVTLRFESPDGGNYTLTIAKRIRSAVGLEMAAPYTVAFTAVSDFSTLLDIQFVATRSDRATGTLSFDVKVTNKSGYDLKVPLLLVLDPSRYFQGSAAGATAGANGLWLLDLGAGLPGGVFARGASTQLTTVKLNNPLGQRVEIGAGVYALPYPNQTPVFSQAPLAQAQAGSPYIYRATAEDPEHSTLTWVMLQGPRGATLDAATGLLSWTPTADSPEQTSVVLRVYDTRGAYATQAFVITTAGANKAPVLDLPPSVRLVEGQAFTLPVIAADPEGHPLSYAANGLPPGARFDSQRNVFEWTPGYDAAGEYRNLSFTVSDGINTVTRSLTVIVDQANAPPVLGGIPDRTVRQGDPVQFTLRATDIDSQTLTYSADLLPPGATLDPNTGVFNWVPPLDSAPAYTLRFRVTDGETTVERAVHFTVLNVNAAPVFAPVVNANVLEGQALTLLLNAVDPDNPRYVPQVRLADGTLSAPETTLPTVTYSVNGLPDGASFDSVTGTLHWTPDYTQAGSYQLVVTATDNGDGTGTPLSTSMTVPITVLNANRPPVVPAQQNLTVQKGQTIDVPFSVTDADGNPLNLAFTVTLKGLPYAVSVNGQPTREGGGTPLFNLVSTGNGTGYLRITPGDRDRGDYIVTLSATDNGDGGGAKAALSASTTFVVKVASASEPPLIATIGPKVAIVGQPLQFTIKATDLDQDALAFTANGKPASATLVAGAQYGSAVFTWTPTAADAGTTSITFVVTDSAGNTDSQTVAVTVRNNNVAPILQPIGNRSVAEGQLLDLQFLATDANGDTLTYSIANAPPGAVFD